MGHYQQSTNDPDLLKKCRFQCIKEIYSTINILFRFDIN